MFEVYKFTYRLNAKHSSNSAEKKAHPHTFEISIYIEHIQVKRLVAFSTIDGIIEQFLLRYQNQCLNVIPPFNQLEPTIENIGNTFYEELKVILRKEQFSLLQLEIGETPLRLYLISDRLMFSSLNNQPILKANSL